MKRRTFIGLLAGFALLPSIVFAGVSKDYTPGIIKQNLNEGKTVFVDYAASWCSVCKRQERIINQLRDSNADYDKNIVFVKVDWDTYATHAVTTERNVPRRSTLILLKKDQELGRIVAGTNKDDIKALLDKAL